MQQISTDNNSDDHDGWMDGWIMIRNIHGFLYISYYRQTRNPLQCTCLQQFQIKGHNNDDDDDRYVDDDDDDDDRYVDDDDDDDDDD